VFATSTILKAFPKLSLVSFSIVDDAGELREDATEEDTLSLEYGCGLFEFTKLPPVHHD